MAKDGKTNDERGREAGGLGEESSVATDKEQLRAELLRRRRQLDERRRREAAAAVCRRLSRRPDRLDGDHLAGYVGFDGELDIRAYLERRLDDGATVSLPKVENDRRMHFVPIEGFESLREGAFGIREPVGRPAPIADLDVIFIPGVGFDRRGGRLGMGWGYYDRALEQRLRADAPAPTLVGVCYACQLVDQVPTEAHDVPVQAVVTEEGWIDCRE